MLIVVVLGTSRSQAGLAAVPLERVTVIGDSIGSAIGYDSTARTVLAHGVDLDLELAICRRLVGESCPYQGLRPPSLVALLPSLQLGSTVVVIIGYNDYEDTFAASVETGLEALRAAGAKRVLWLTLRAERQSYLNMNDVIRAAVASHPELTVVDWNVYSRSHPDWFQSDGLHLTGAGANAMADLVHRSLDELGLVAHPVVPVLAIVTPTLPKARVGRAYIVHLTASGGARPIHWLRAVGTIPAGLRFGRGGLLTGTPRVAGRRLITLRATDAGGRSVMRRFLLTVAPR
jgi:hypothetical protein